METVPVPAIVADRSELLYLERVICGACLRQTTCTEDYKPCEGARNAFICKDLILIHKEEHELRTVGEFDCDSGR
jgi:hypothetical protein